jgi:hypothetical protein
MDFRGCAEAPNGRLLDASAITWYNDVDDMEPIPPLSAAATAGSSAPPSRQASATTLDRFFANVPPAQKTAGSCRSARIPRPSIRATDPDNAMALKHKSSSGTGISLPRRRTWHVVSDSDSDEATEHEDTEKATLSNPADADYGDNDGGHEGDVTQGSQRHF